MGFEVRVIDFILLYSSFSFLLSYLLFITLPFEGGSWFHISTSLRKKAFYCSQQRWGVNESLGGRVFFLSDRAWCSR